MREYASPVITAPSQSLGLIGEVGTVEHLITLSKPLSFLETVRIAQRI